MSHRPQSPLPLPGRRGVLRGSLAASAALALPTALGSAPAFALSGRPEAGWGVQAGDVSAHSGLVWVRSARPRPDDRRDVRDRVLPQPAQMARSAARRGLRLHRYDTAATRLPSGEQIHYREAAGSPPRSCAVRASR